MATSAPETAPLRWSAGPAATEGWATLACLGTGADAWPRVPLPRLDGPDEHWLTPAPVRGGECDGAGYAQARDLTLVAFVESEPDGDIEAAAARAYRRLLALRETLDCPHLLRVWHYLPHINSGDGDRERYKRFCAGRAAVLDAYPDTAARLPAATVVGGETPGLHLHALMGPRPPTPVENPRQVSAYRYPRQYGPRRPAFARAARLDWPGARPQLLLSGTASIVGHASRHAEHAAAQARESLDNVAAVLAAAGPEFARGGLDCLVQLTVYMRHPGDVAAVAEALRPRLPARLCVRWLRADLCRRDLLVELEAVAAA